MILFLSHLIETSGNAIKGVTEVVTQPNFLDQITNLLEVLVWPLTVFGGLLLFRKHFSKLINSLGSIKAGAQGFEMNFIEEKLQEATKLIGIGSMEILAKSGSSIIPKSNHAETPYQELLELQDMINQKLKNRLSSKNITTNGASNFALVSELANNNIIDNQKARQLKSLIELTNMALNTPKISPSQVAQMKQLFNNISL
jgi:hypothetical protein